MIYWTHLRTHKQTNNRTKERKNERKKKERRTGQLGHFKDENTYGSNTLTTERNAFSCLGTVFNDHSLRKTAAKSQLTFLQISEIPVFYHLGNPLFIPVLNEIFPKQLLNYLKLVCRCISMNFLC